MSVLLFFGIIALAIVFFHAWLHVTNPYAAWNIVRQPYVTQFKQGTLMLSKCFGLRVHDGKLAQLLGYYKSGFLILQNTYFGSRRTHATQSKEILKEIHHKRFDPSKPYLISGDQFSVLYPRNLGVFYNDLLNPLTADSKIDWENRQRLYLQSALYALDAFSQAETLTTTIVPIGRRSVLLTQVHPGSVPSDTLYGIFYALAALQESRDSPKTPFHLQTAAATRQLVGQRRGDMQKLLAIYLQQVRDPRSGLVRRDIHLAAARDGVVRQSSFYDNVILWKTLSLAHMLGVATISKKELVALKATILSTFWDKAAGHFKDDIRPDLPGENYCSDWLIALPTGFLDPADTAEQKLLEQIVGYVRAHNIAQPLPIKYTASNPKLHKPWAVRVFVPNYGGEAIWSYWGSQYITLLADLYAQTKNSTYRTEATQMIRAYRHRIERDQGFAETFAPNGEFLQNLVYKSIRQTGWVVQFETAVVKIEGSSRKD